MDVVDERSVYGRWKVDFYNADMDGSDPTNRKVTLGPDAVLLLTSETGARYEVRPSLHRTGGYELSWPTGEEIGRSLARNAPPWLAPKSTDAT